MHPPPTSPSSLGTHKTFFLIITVSFILTALIAVMTRYPMAEDVTFHLKIAKGYYEGKTVREVLDETKIPYPPLFHYILMIGIWLRIPVLFPLIIQVFLYPFALLSTGLLVKKYLSWGHAIVVLLLLIGSWGFMDRAIQVQPQAFDMILFPFSVYSFLEKKKLAFIASNSVMFYCHSYYGLLLFGSFCMYFLMRRKGFWMLVMSGMTFIPLISMTVPVLMDKVEYTINTTESQ